MGLWLQEVWSYLWKQRIELLNKQNVQKQELVAKKGSLVELTALDAKIKEERMQKGMRLAKQLDQKVLEQQQTVLQIVALFLWEIKMCQ